MDVKLVKSDVLGKIIEKQILKEKRLVEIVNAKFISYGKEDKYVKKMQKNILLFSPYKDKIFSIIYRFINLYKGGNYCLSDFQLFYIKNIENNIYSERKRHLYFLNMMKDIIKKYNVFLKINHLIDYHDMINISIKIISKKCLFSYKYIIIDEYQDISLNKLKLIKMIQEKTGAKLIVVGDDFQSIYGFTGSNLDVINNFKDYFSNCRIIKLRNTYRNSKELLKITQDFICKNPYQIKKRLRSSKSVKYPIIICYYEKDISEVWSNVLGIVGDKDVLVLGRNNNDIDKIPYLTNNMKFLTIHKSKGLECDVSIIVNLEDEINGLPCKIQDSEYLFYVKSKIDDYKYSEERRLFYVALTRCRSYNVLLVPRNNPSVFIKEIIDNKNVKVIGKKK